MVCCQKKLPKKKKEKIKTFSAVADINDLRIKLANLKAVASTQIDKDLGAAMLSRIGKNFDEQGYTNDGGVRKWESRPFERYLNYKKLDYTHRLRRSFKVKSYQTSRSGKTIVVGTNVPYAKVHNEGGVPRSKKFIRRPPASSKKIRLTIHRVKKRQFMGFGREDERVFKIIIKRSFDRAMK